MPRLGTALPEGDFVGFLSGAGAAWWGWGAMGCGCGTVWLSWTQTGCGGSRVPGRQGTEPGAPSLGCGLLFDLKHHWGCLSKNSLMDTETQRRELTCPRSPIKLCQEPRPPRLHRLSLTSPDSLGLQTPIRGRGQSQGHLTVQCPQQGEQDPRVHRKQMGMSRVLWAGVIRRATLGNHLGGLKKVLLPEPHPQKF